MADVTVTVDAADIAVSVVDLPAIDVTVIGPPGPPGTGGAGSDHGALDGLSDDDHTQYHTDARGDARYDALGAATAAMSAHTGAADPHPVYLTSAEGNAAFATSGHTHTAAGVGAEPAGAVAAHAGAADPHTGYQKESEKGAASGYASLDAGTKVPIAQVPTGTTGTTVALGNHAHAGVYDPAGTAATAVTNHAAAADPHTGYLKPTDVIAGTNVTLTATADTVTINAAGGAGGTEYGYGRSVLDYGADPTGVALCDTAFTNALAANAVVLVPIGTFKISQPVTMVSGKSLIGEAGAKDGNDTTPMSKILQTGNQPIVTGSAVRGVILENLWLEAASPGTHTADGVYFPKGVHAATNYVTVTNVHVKGVGRDGFAVENLIVSTWTGAAAVGCGRYGINLYGQEVGAAGTSFTLNGCYGNNCGQKTAAAGIRVRKMVYASLNGCAAEGNVGGPQYDFSQCQGIAVNGCGSEDPITVGQAGFKVWDNCLGVVLTGCWSYQNKGQAFDVAGSHNIVLTGCVEMDPAAGATAAFRTDAASNVTLINPNWYTAQSLGAQTMVINDSWGSVTIPGDAIFNTGIYARDKAYFGPAGGTVNLYRSAASTLKTDTNLLVGGKASQTGAPSAGTDLTTVTYATGLVTTHAATAGHEPLSTTTPAALGTAAVGVGTTTARADHVHQMPTAAEVGAATQAYVDARTPKITVASTAPGSPTTGDVWIDTT